MAKIVDAKSPELKAITKEARKLPEDMVAARVSGQRSVGYMVKEEARDYIESAGAGTWKTHPFTKKFYTKFRRGSRLRKRKRKHRGAFDFMGAFVRYRLRGKTLVVSYGKRKDSISPQLVRIGYFMERGYEFTATKEMRRFIARSRSFHRSAPGKYTGVKGKDWFLITKGKRLKVPKRKVGDPVFAIVKPKAYPLFERRTVKALGRRNKLADKEFRKGLSEAKE